MYDRQPIPRNNARRKKSPGFLKRWLYNMVNSVRDYHEYNNVPTLATEPVNNRFESQSQLNFSVYFADGGRVVQMNYYDKRNEQSTNRLYIITDDKDFGRELDKIITMEGIRR
jgi:hypothetical protein